MDVGVLALTETHLQYDRDADQIHRFNPELTFIYDLGRNLSCCNAIVVRRDITYNVVALPLEPLINTNKRSLPQGRACAAKLSFIAEKINMVAVYAPNLKKKRSTFLIQLLDATSGWNDPKIFLGDCNCTPSPIDRAPPHFTSQDDSVTFRLSLDATDTVDIFREIYPSTLNFTYQHSGRLRPSFSRIDLILIPRSLCERLSQAEILLIQPSDQVAHAL